MVEAVLSERPGWRVLLAQVGPGLVVMLADTEAGSVITAAQSGAKWGYRLLLLQVLIIPLLYMVQELAGRLALSSGQGYVELIRRRFGRQVALLTVLTLVTSCFGALVTEMGGLVGVGHIFGVPGGLTVALLCAMILFMVATGAYQSVERLVISLGLFELVFLVIAWKSHPQLADLQAQWRDQPLARGDYLYLVAANLGTCIMPWAVFYQQSALIDKGLDLSHLRMMRVDTLAGAVLCQLITAAILVAAAAALGAGHGGGAPFETVGEISAAFSGVLGTNWGRTVFAIGFSGGAMVATVVVCLTAAWAIGELLGVHHSLEKHPLEAPWFYAAFAAMLLLGGGLVLSGIGIVRLSLAMGVLNAMLLPVVLGSLFWLARTEASAAVRLQGPYALAVGLAFALVAVVGFVSGLAGLLA